MTRFVSPNPGSTQLPSADLLAEPAAETPPPGRRRGFLLMVLTGWLGLGFSTGALVAFGSLPVVVERPDVAAGPRPFVLPMSHRNLSEPRFWRPAGSIAERPVTRLQPRRFRPALRIAVADDLWPLPERDQPAFVGPQLTLAARSR